MERIRIVMVAVILAATGCRSSPERENDAAMEQAKQQAAVTGVAQRLVYTDRDGSLVTSIIEPPGPGETSERITTTRSLSRDGTRKKLVIESVSNQP